MSMQNHRVGKDDEHYEAYSKSSSDSHKEVIETRVYFAPSYTGAVHLILGSFVVDTADTVDEALQYVKRYQPAAKRCGKPVELVPVDSSYQTSVLTISEWLAAQITPVEKK